MRKKILIIEDTPDLLRNMVRAFMLEGYEVFEALHGDEATEILKHTTPDVIITDLLMSPTDGMALIEHIKSNKAQKEIPIIVFSAISEHREKAFSLGVVNFISKPTSLENIVNSVKEAF